MQALSTAAAGLSAQQQKIDLIAGNMANISTTAYKSADAGFQDTLYTAMENPESGGAAVNLQSGTGAKLSSTAIDFSQGTVQVTGNAMDFAIEGDAFFRLMRADGEYVYTKDGSFTVSAEAGGVFLVNDDGYYVLNRNNSRVLILENAGDFVVRSDGSISGEVPLGIYTFENTGGLLREGNNLFSESASSGGAVPAGNYTVRQGALEGSNVDLASELSELIQAQRAFSLASRALQTADNMEGLANNIRR